MRVPVDEPRHDRAPSAVVERRVTGRGPYLWCRPNEADATLPHEGGFRLRLPVVERDEAPVDECQITLHPCPSRLSPPLPAGCLVAGYRAAI
jgi:hypothetical protein